MQEWLDPGVRYNVEQNQSHGLHKISFVVQVTVTYAIHVRRMCKKYTELDRSVFKHVCTHVGYSLLSRGLHEAVYLPSLAPSRETAGNYFQLRPTGGYEAAPLI